MISIFLSFSALKNQPFVSSGGSAMCGEDPNEMPTRLSDTCEGHREVPMSYEIL